MASVKDIFGPKPKRKRGKKTQRVVMYPLLKPETATAGLVAPSEAAGTAASTDSSAAFQSDETAARGRADSAAHSAASSSSSSSATARGGKTKEEAAAPSSTAAKASSGAGAAKAKRVVYVRRVKAPGRAKPAQSGQAVGSRVSGRAWKDAQQVRTSVLLKPKANEDGGAWRAQQAMSVSRRRAKEATDAVRQARRERLQAERDAREERKRKREEGEARATVYQKISNPDKVKKMSKKQLRAVKRMRVNERGVVEFVSPWMKYSSRMRSLA